MNLLKAEQLKQEALAVAIEYREVSAGELVDSKGMLLVSSRNRLRSQSEMVKPIGPISEHEDVFDGARLALS